MDYGSSDGLTASTWWRPRAKVRRIRAAVDLDSPLSAAMDACEECVASFVGARQGSDDNRLHPLVEDLPGSPRLLAQAVQARFMEAATPPRPLSAAGSRVRRPCWFDLPCARPGSIRRRWAGACPDVARRGSVPRASSIDVTSALGRPLRATRAPLHTFIERQAQETRRVCR